MWLVPESWSCCYMLRLFECLAAILICWHLDMMFERIALKQFELFLLFVTSRRSGLMVWEVWNIYEDSIRRHARSAEFELMAFVSEFDFASSFWKRKIASDFYLFLISELWQSSHYRSLSCVLCLSCSSSSSNRKSDRWCCERDGKDGKSPSIKFVWSSSLLPYEWQLATSIANNCSIEKLTV